MESWEKDTPLAPLEGSFFRNSPVSHLTHSPVFQSWASTVGTVATHYALFFPPCRKVNFGESLRSSTGYTYTWTRMTGTSRRSSFGASLRSKLIKRLELVRRAAAALLLFWSARWLKHVWNRWRLAVIELSGPDPEAELAPQALHLHLLRKGRQSIKGRHKHSSSGGAWRGCPPDCGFNTR